MCHIVVWVQLCQQKANAMKRNVHQQLINRVKAMTIQLNFITSELGSSAKEQKRKKVNSFEGVIIISLAAQVERGFFLKQTVCFFLRCFEKKTLLT